MLYLYGLLGVACTAAAAWLVRRYRLRRRYQYLALVPALICFTLLFRVLLDWQFSTLGLLYAILRVEGSHGAALPSGHGVGHKDGEARDGGDANERTRARCGGDRAPGEPRLGLAPPAPGRRGDSARDGHLGDR